MPGIAAIIGAQPFAPSRHSAEVMVRQMVHEQFYSSGTYDNERLGICAGWACLKGTFSDCLPVWNERKDVCLVISGEIFSDATEIDGLRRNGHSFDRAKASWLVDWYEQIGLKFLERLNGWFSGLLLDFRERKIVLFNDRFGLGRIYYHENGEGFYLGSEAKSLLKVLPALRRLDFRGAAEVVSCGCVLQNRTLFSGISLLPGGSMWTFRAGEPARKEAYFTRETWEQQPQLNGQEYYAKLRETFPRILPRYFTGNRGIGMSLTGGLDGRMIMAWAGRPPGALPCYTFGSSYRDCSDVRLARQVARSCEQSHQVIPVDGEFVSEFPALAARSVYLSDGAMDVTGSVELYVNQIARQIAPVRLTGNYGSEIVRGNIAFKPRFFGDGLFVSEFERSVKAARGTYGQEAHCHPMTFIAFKQVPWHHHSRLSVEQSQLTVRAPYLDNELVSLMYQAPPDLVVSKGPSFRLIAEGSPSLSRIPTDRGLLYQPVPIVTKARHLYEEFTFKAEYAYDYGMPQWLAKTDQYLAPLRLERLFLGRHKFYHFRVWYRDRLAAYLKSVLLDPRALARPYVRRSRLEQLVAYQTSGHGNYTSELHKLLTLELLQRSLIEGQ